MNRTEHLLVTLMEECAEVQQACSKALRFGLSDSYPGKSESNANHIIRELTELLAIIDMLSEAKVLSNNINPDIKQLKIDKVEHWLKYAKKQGTIL